MNVGLMTPAYDIYDGGHVEFNCTDINKAQFSYNNGVFLLGAAYMYNYVCYFIPFFGRSTRADNGTNRPRVRNGSSESQDCSTRLSRISSPTVLLMKWPVKSTCPVPPIC